METVTNISQILKLDTGSSHAITGYKCGNDCFITLWHDNYIPTSIGVHIREEDMMHPAVWVADLDPETGKITSSIPGIENLADYFRLVYIARQGEVVRDDS